MTVTNNYQSEPWRMDESAVEYCCFDTAIVSSQDNDVTKRGRLKVAEVLHEEDALRICACVNACAGISTKALLDRVLVIHESPNAILQKIGEAPYTDTCAAHCAVLKRWIDNGGREPDWEENRDAALVYFAWLIAYNKESVDECHE